MLNGKGGKKKTAKTKEIITGSFDDVISASVSNVGKKPKTPKKVKKK